MEKLEAGEPWAEGGAGGRMSMTEVSLKSDVESGRQGKGPEPYGATLNLQGLVNVL